MVRKILLLGDPALYEQSVPVEKEDWDKLDGWVTDLHDTLMDYRARYGAGRAIAAPQIGIPKRLIYMNIKEPVVFINPRLAFEDEEMMPVRDDCMSFPGLTVNVMRYKRCTVYWRDENGEEHSARYKGDLSELIQHEYDHLDGILATMQAVDNKALFYSEG